MEKLSNALQERGYHVLIFMASQKAGNIDKVVEELLDYQVDGIIAASVALGSDLSDRCRAAGVPMVLFNRSQDDERMSAVTSDNLAGGRKVAEFLLGGGHRRIGYIAGWEGASTQRDREAGFVEALAEQCAAIVLDEFPVSRLRLKLSKPGAVRGSSAVGVPPPQCRCPTFMRSGSASASSPTSERSVST